MKSVLNYVCLAIPQDKLLSKRVNFPHIILWLYSR